MPAEDVELTAAEEFLRAASGYCGDDYDEDAALIKFHAIEDEARGQMREDGLEGVDADDEIEMLVGLYLRVSGELDDELADPEHASMLARDCPWLPRLLAAHPMRAREYAVKSQVREAKQNSSTYDARLVAALTRGGWQPWRSGTTCTRRCVTPRPHLIRAQPRRRRRTRTRAPARAAGREPAEPSDPALARLRAGASRVAEYRDSKAVAA